MNELTPEQSIKAQLVVLAEYLQTTLSEPQVRLYAAELMDLGPDGLARAIAALKADETIWPGRFPLPAKIRSYLMGEVNTLVSESLARIMKCHEPRDIYALPPLEREVAEEYGIKSITERAVGDTGTVYAQLRDALRAKYARKIASHKIKLVNGGKKETPLLD